MINMAECWLINLDELENLNKSEVGSLKEMITKSNIRIRRPYGHNNENLPRRASFVGSVNAAQFLTDTTGGRRFLCFEAVNIHHQHDVDMNQVYAQALALFRGGYQYWFNQAETAEIERNNEEYRAKSVEEELLLTYFKPCGKEEADMYLNATQVLEKMRERGSHINPSTNASRNLGMIMQKHGFLRMKKGGLYVYALRERKPIEIASDKHRATVNTNEYHMQIMMDLANRDR